MLSLKSCFKTCREQNSESNFNLIKALYSAAFTFKARLEYEAGYSDVICSIIKIKYFPLLTASNVLFELNAR